ncbi:hypothetical protein AB1398_02900, partial [Hydrogenibacillus schlegelii]
MAGRVLTNEQHVRRLKRTECSDLATRDEALLFLVQALLYEVSLRLAAGMCLEFRDGAPVFVCRRCGTASRTVETHLCADCGTEDVFCPACAALGPVRGCTAVFRAAEASGASGTGLLRERISIRRLPTIFEALADHGAKVKDPA